MSVGKFSYNGFDVEQKYNVINLTGYLTRNAYTKQDLQILMDSNLIDHEIKGGNIEADFDNESLDINVVWPTEDAEESE